MVEAPRNPPELALYPSIARVPPDPTLTSPSPRTRARRTPRTTAPGIP